MIETRTQLTDQGSIGKYFALMLHIDDDELDPYEYRLLGHYRRVCGATNKPCFESTLMTAKITRMSDDKVRDTRDKLEKLGRIIVERPSGSTVKVTVCDLMSRNVEQYSVHPSRKQEGVHSDTPPENRRGGLPKTGVKEESYKKKESKTLSEPASQASEEAPEKPQIATEPIAPQGYRWLCSSSSDSLMHLIPAVSNDKSARPLCKAKVPHRVAYNPRNVKPHCQACLRIASEPPKPKPEKPTAYASQPVFEALAEVVFGITDPTDIGELGGRVGPIRQRLIGHVLKKRGVNDLDEPTLTELVSHIKRFGKWYDEQCKGCPRPASPDKFMTHWLKYTKKAAAQNGKPKFNPQTGEWSKPS